MLIVFFYAFPFRRVGMVSVGEELYGHVCIVVRCVQLSFPVTGRKQDLGL